MANPQPTDAHLRVAHTINEAIMMRDFSKRQRKILDLILRLSWGCNKKSAIIPKQRDFEIVGIGEGHIKIELNWLTESHIINIEDTTYSFNKDFDQWQVSRVKPFTPEKLTELVSFNLNGTAPQLTEMVSSEKENLPNREVRAYQNSKLSTPKLATPKEKLNKDIDNINNKDKEFQTPEEKATKYSRQKFSHMVKK